MSNRSRRFRWLLLGALVVGVVADGAFADAASRRPRKSSGKPVPATTVASKRTTVPKPTQPARASGATATTTIDSFGRTFCGDAGVKVRVPVTTIGCQQPVANDQVATREAVLAAYERYWITRMAVLREPRLGAHEWPKVLVAEALNEEIALSAKNQDSYWDGTRDDIKLLNTQVVQVSAVAAEIRDCVTIGGTARTHPDGKPEPGGDGLDRLAYQFTASNIKGVWLFTRVGLTDEASKQGESTCSAAGG